MFNSGEGVGRAGWVSEVRNHEVSPESREVKALSMAVGSDGVKRFPYRNRVYLCSQLRRMDAQHRVPQFALKVSLGTFQFNLSFLFTMWN